MAAAAALDFVCQRCQKHVDVDESLLQVDESLINAAKPRWHTNSPSPRPDSPPPSPDTNNGATAPNSLQLRPSSSLANFSTTSDDMTRSLAAGKSTGLSKQSIAQRLFELASDATRIDHPLCAECAQIVCSELSRQINELEQDHDRKVIFVQQLDDELASIDQEQSIDDEINQLMQDEQELRLEFRQVELEREHLQEEIAKIERNSQQAQTIEERFWQALNEFESVQHQLHNERRALQIKMEHTSEKLDQLRRTCVLNDAFRIWYDGHCGTINGLRLGRLPSQQVDWNEINAALGEAAHLLHSLAQLLCYRFASYQIVPVGSQSLIVNTRDRSIIELFAPLEITLGRLFWFRSFDRALVIFAALIAELAAHIRTKDAHFRLPYEINKDVVGGHRIHVNDEEVWTKALKCILTDLKWLLAWSVQQ